MTFYERHHLKMVKISKKAQKKGKKGPQESQNYQYESFNWPIRTNGWQKERNRLGAGPRVTCGDTTKGSGQSRA